MAIDRSEFAEECVRQGLYCGVNPHYMLGVAQLRSGISDTNQNDAVGAFRITQIAWNANCTDTEFDFNFLPADISDSYMQCAVFALMTHRAFDAFVLKNGRNPSAKELYLAQWPGTADPPLSADFQKALDDTASLVGPAATAVLGDDQAGAAIPVITKVGQQPSGQPSGPIQLTGVPQARQPMAQKIIDAFAKAGLGIIQQATALANAISESSLNPNAHAAIGEDSWGLFQLNRNGGLGQGHNPADLENPDINIAIVIAEAKKYSEFVDAGSLDRAVSAFVRDVEKPADVSGEIVKRLKIAQALLPSNPVAVADSNSSAARSLAVDPDPSIAPGVAASGGINGFDCAHYPGDGVMDWLRNHGGFQVTGFYLSHWPGKPDYSWISKRSSLASKGWGFFPTYVGLQLKSAGLGIQSGNAHALEAVQLMQTAGFSSSSVVYLDLESGDAPSGDYANYIKAWIAMVKNSQFTPGLYCSYRLISWARQQTPFVWSFRIPNGTNGQTYDPSQLPPDTVDSNCVGTQYRQEIKLLGLTIPPSIDNGLDLNICAMPDPSHVASVTHVLGPLS